MSKLELKHIVGYLPYGLPFIDKYETKQGVKLLTGICGNIIYYDDEKSWTSIDCVSPILRPMSDLNKSIQHPVDKSMHSNLAYPFDLEFCDGHFYDRYYADQCESPHVDVSVSSMNLWLFEWNFDVFGLIDQGLAIDINHL